MIRRLLLAAAACIGFAAPALATQDCATTAPFSVCTITNSSAVALVVPAGATYLSIDNESATATIACNFSNGTAALNTAGNYTIGPGQTRVWQLGGFRGGLLPSGNLNCISSAATSPATIDVR